ncbi:MAG: 3-hydroxyacyl-CoA dehydrogenase family protein [bacterium]
MGSYVTVEEIREIAVVGGGYVGHGVAQMFAQGGYPVRMYNRTAESSARAMADVEKGLALFVRAELSTPAEAEEALARVRPLTDLPETVRGADFVVEAVVDRLPVKREVFGEMDAHAPGRAILASETSGLRMTDIAAGLKRPERCVSTHNYTPPPLLPVLEVVAGERTDPEVVETACALMRRIGKEPVLCKEIPGNIGSRFTNCLRREAFHIVEQGYATPEAVDAVMRSLGRVFPVMGILALTDFTGLDMSYNSQRNILPHLAHNPEPSGLVDGMVAEGRLGIKSGEGFYQWPPERIREFYEARGEELLRWLQRPPPPPLPPAGGTP